MPKDTRVSIEEAPCRALRRATRWTCQAAQVTTGAVSAIRIHCHPRSAARHQRPPQGQIPQRDEDGDRDVQPAAQRRHRVGPIASRRGRILRHRGDLPGGVPKSFDLGDQIGDLDLRPDLQRRALRGVADRRLHAVHPVQPALDACRAGRVRHPDDPEFDVPVLDGPAPARSGPRGRRDDRACVS